MILDMRRRAMGNAVPMFAKGAAGARAAMGHLREGGVLAMLVDQKMNDGIAVPFFGHTAMTPAAAAAFALRFRCPILPALAERLGPARFRVICEAPLPLPDTGDRQADIATLTTSLNACLERWIRARPEQWLWLHRRWPKEVYR
jgi:KDO2-lipid IV(A) lauroyltransferase